MKRPPKSAGKNPLSSRKTAKLKDSKASRLRASSKVAKKSRSLASKNVEYVDFGPHSSLTKIVVRWVLVAVAALAVLIAVAVYSPVLAVTKISVRGTNDVDPKAITKSLSSQIGKPLPQINEAEIATLLAPYRLIESFTVVSVPPHTLVVRIVERTPIAIVYVGDNFYYFDPAGVKLGVARDTSKLPVLDVKGIPRTSKTFKTAIAVLLALPADLLPKIALVSARSTDNVSFRLRGYAGQKVIWGDKSEAALKSRVLAALIKNQSPTSRVTYDVSSPNSPTVRY